MTERQAGTRLWGSVHGRARAAGRGRAAEKSFGVVCGVEAIENRPEFGGENIFVWHTEGLPD